MKSKHQTHNERKNRKRVKKPALAFRLLVGIISPVIFLSLIEIILTLFSYGQPKDFFIRWWVPAGFPRSGVPQRGPTTGGETVYLTNQHYCEHFVPKELSRAPEPSVLRSKDKSTIRIFVLGSSAANGDPDPAFGFCRQLEVLLNEHSDQRSFEVINAAVTSMNSHVARRIAQDCAIAQPDAFIVLMGNNEVVGPYGPSALPEMLYSSRKFINASITAQKEFKIGQLMKNCIYAVRTYGRPEKKWLGMEAFLTNQVAQDDPKLKYCYQHFLNNLSDIVQTAYNSGAKTILCTVPTNIRTCAPFSSKHKEGLTKDQITEWERYFRNGRELELSGDFEASLAQYEKVKEIDDTYAELCFCMGRCLDALGRSSDARDMFIKARDLDTLRFRADSQINRMIRKAAAIMANRGATLLDLEEYLEKKIKKTEDGRQKTEIPSSVICHLSSDLREDLFVDHVHLNFQGNFLAAYSAMQVIRETIPAAKLKIPELTEEELLDLCRRRLLYDDNEQYRLAMVMYRRKTLPPFAGQIDHEKEMTGLREKLFELRRTTKESSVSRFSISNFQFEIFNPRLYRGQSTIENQQFIDSYLIRRYGEFLLRNGRVSDAIRAYQKILRIQPFNMSIRIKLARAFAQGGMKDEAVGVLTSKETPDRYSHKEALLMLGAYYAENGRITEAQTIYQQLKRIDPDNVDVLTNLAAAALYRSDFDTMKRNLDRALKIHPQSIQAMINMGNYYAKRNQPGEAQEWFAKAVQAEPQNYLAQIGLGVQTIRAGHLNSGMEHVIKAVQLKPDFADGYQILVTIYKGLGREDEAKNYADLRDLFQQSVDGK